MIFKVKKGKHYSQFNLAKLQPFATQMEGVFNIDITWWYEPIPKCDDWNKLTGISEMDIPFSNDRGIHYNSGRLVFKSAKEYGWFDVAIYVYDKGVRKSRKFTKVKANKDYNFGVMYNTMVGCYDMYCGEDYTFMSAEQPKGITRKCYPYHGGDCPAIRNCITEIKRD